MPARHRSCSQFRWSVLSDVPDPWRGRRLFAFISQVRRCFVRSVRLQGKTSHLVQSNLAKPAEPGFLNVRQLGERLVQQGVFPFFLQHKVLSKLLAARAPVLGIDEAGSELANAVHLLHNVARQNPLAAMAL